MAEEVGLYYKLGIDIDNLENKKQAVKDFFREVGEAAKASGVTMDQSFSNPNIQASLQAIAEKSAETAAALQTLIDVETAHAETAEKTSQSIEKMASSSGLANNAFGSLPGPIKSVTGEVKNLTSKAWEFIKTPIGAVIGAIVFALQALWTWLNSSVEGQLKLAQMTGYLQGVLGQLKEVLIQVGGALYHALNDPAEAGRKIWSGFKAYLLEQWNQIKDAGSALGKILEGVFTFNTDKIREGVNDLAEQAKTWKTVAQEVGEGVQSWAKSVDEAARATAAISREEAELGIEMSKWNSRKMELAKAKAEAQMAMYDSSLSAAERKKALNEYKAILNEEYAQEEKFADRKIELQKRRMELTTNGIEDENQLRELEAERLALDARKAQDLASLQRRVNAINNASLKDDREYLKAKKEALAAEKELQKLQNDARQAEIDSIEDAHEKKIAQIQHNYAKELQTIETQKKEWEIEQKSGLTDEQTAALDASRLAAEQKLNAELKAENKAYLKDLLGDILTYEQSRQKLQEEYAEKRKKLYEHDENGNETGLKSGVTQGNIDELDRNLQQSLEKIDLQFASRSEQFNSWCKQIAGWSIEQLEKAIDEAEETLAAMKDDGDYTDQDIAEARAKLAKLRDARDKADPNKKGPTAMTIKQWQDLNKILSKSKKEFDELGDAIGGTVGEIIKAAGSIASEVVGIVSSMQSLVNNATTGMQGTAQAAGESIKTVERASVILTVISAALGIATKIASLFNNDKSKQKEIENLQERIDQLQWELDNAELVRTQKHLQTQSFLGEVRKSLYESRRELAGSAQGWELFIAYTQRASKNTQLLEKTASKLANTYANLGYTVDKALGEEKYAGAKNTLENISKQQVLLQEQLDLERSKKKSDPKRIDELEKQIEEKGYEAVKVINEMVEDIIGGSAQDIAKDLGDAFFEAFKAGEDAAQAWADKVDELVAGIIKNMLVSRFLEAPLGEIFDKYKDRWFREGNFVGLQAVMDSMGDFSADLKKIGSDFSEIFDALPDDIKNMALFTADAQREGVSRGIATASQESVDELNGRATAIQGHTYSIAENTKQLTENVSVIMRSVMNIDRNTDGLADRIAKMQADINESKSLLSDIQLKGIKML